jgi:hypothetical protein
MSARPRRGDPDARALLFGPRAGGAAVGGRVGAARPAYAADTPGSGALAAAEAEAAQQRNGQAVDALRDRVGDMRHLALDIGEEVAGQNALLDGMGGAFDGAGDRLGEVMVELRRLSRSGAGGHLCAMMGFMFLFFFLVYLLLK